MRRRESRVNVVFSRGQGSDPVLPRLRVVRRAGCESRGRVEPSGIRRHDRGRGEGPVRRARRREDALLEAGGGPVPRARRVARASSRLVAATGEPEREEANRQHRRGHCEPNPRKHQAEERRQQTGRNDPADPRRRWHSRFGVAHERRKDIGIEGVGMRSHERSGDGP